MNHLLGVRMKFNGNQQHAQIQSWVWGVAFSVEVYCVYTSFGFRSRILDFGSGAPANNFLLTHWDTTNNGAFVMYTASSPYFYQILPSNFWPTNTWVHVVVTHNGMIMESYKNGVSVGYYAPA